jgi:energy-coupling factor transporter ATP-binding protein EcfA2
VDWFSYFVASTAWSRLAQSGVDSELAARVVWATVSQGRFALKLMWERHWRLLACARFDDSSLGSDRLLLGELEAAVAEPFPNAAPVRNSGVTSIVDTAFDWVGGFEPRALLHHDWAPVPLFSTGMELASEEDWYQSLLPVVSETGAAVDLDRRSSEALLDLAQLEHFSELFDKNDSEDATEPNDMTIDDLQAVEIHGEPWLDVVRSNANRTFSNFLTDAPHLRVEMRPPLEWYQGNSPLKWWADDPSGVAVELSELSTAQKRWSSLAIQLAIRGPLGNPEAGGATHRLLVLDEPEAALHATAQRFLAKEIGQVAPDLQVIVASHSPAFLDHTGFRLHHVHRGQGGRTALTQLPRDQLEAEVRSLGMAPSDLFQHFRIFVVVEGRHDEIILNSCVGEELAGLGARILAMGGAAQLSPVVDSRLIFDSSDAKVLVVIDNTDNQVLAIWQRAIEAAGSGSLSEARTILEELGREGESGFIRNFGIRAVEQGRTDRIELYGLSEPDILFYLSPASLIPKASGKTWDRLQTDAGAKSGTKFKRWLRDTYDFSGDDTVLESAVSQLDDLPRDFIGLIEKATSMARDSWWR